MQRPFFVPMNYAILIDAGFLKHKLGSAAQPMGLNEVRALVTSLQSHPLLAEHHLHRIYYYDALPFQGKETVPLQGGVRDFSISPTAKRQEQLLSQIRQEPFFAVRAGELSFEGWGIPLKLLNTKQSELTIKADDLRPRISQKGVDMRIGMDMATLTLKHIAQILVLVTGDSDFVPAMKFARREGATVFVVPLGHRIKDVVREHADYVFDLLPKDVLVQH